LVLSSAMQQWIAGVGRQRYAFAFARPAG
jgi:hypothetical protein